MLSSNSLPYGNRFNTMKSRMLVWALIVVSILAARPGPVRAQPEETELGKPGEKLTLVEALMCEDIDSVAPKNPTVVFSVVRDKAVCFTSFDPVPEKTVIYHNWFYRDKPSARVKLSLRPPRWSTFSSIKLRETDKGPWRVEVSDSEGTILHILRFSIRD
jgi:hypothetical protein